MRMPRLPLARLSPARLTKPRLPGWLPLRTRRIRVVALAVALALIAGLTVVLWPRPSHVQVTAYFPRTVGIYPGSDVRVLGVRVGEIKKITPQGGRVRVDLEYEAEHKIPADAQAAIINSSVVSDRYLQLLPVYRGGATMADGAVIPEKRTAVPVELDRVFDSLHTTSEALGPKGANKDGSLSRLLGVSADNLEGQGATMHQTVEDLSQAITTLSDGRKDAFGTVKNLQNFTSALVANDKSVRAFNESLAKVAKQLSGERKDLGSALRELSLAMKDVAGFVRGNKKALTKNVKGLSEVTRVLVKQRAAMEEFLDVAPAGLGNLGNAYNPGSGTLDTRNNAEHPQGPGDLMCSLLKTAGETSDCKELKGLFDALPAAPEGLHSSSGPPPGSATTDRSLGGILGVST